MYWQKIQETAGKSYSVPMTQEEWSLPCQAV